ncbi:MAG: glucosylceramidase [Bacteroidetes bacterium]|nr:glucosylceramidase [Bacteroidota bacterium]MBU1373032.1 glucosylceramidase [Bacteroidota bacterium]MBU1485475.1 glucosylceramidase [Bacteroidota bacterium]MBU1761706.1 glucosylceramidase [Bacteroidota bacterium]MBU2045144.1 glucosylceramidase [Bacteroidota bacterium]
MVSPQIINHSLQDHHASSKNRSLNQEKEYLKSTKTFKTKVDFWLTNGNKTALFQKQQVDLIFSKLKNGNQNILVDDKKSFQSIDGFGFALTGASANLIHALPEKIQDDLIYDLFAVDSTHIGISYLRISIGASDLSDQPFTYDDLASGETDINLKKFNIERERMDLIPVLKKILAINPDIKIMGSPWTAPIWMKTNASFKGGNLKPEFYESYANYFVKYIKIMAAEGVKINAITPQNEPLFGGNNPSMVMEAKEQTDFIKNHLGPAFQRNGINTKIIIYDHNADRPDYPIGILSDPKAYPYIDGSAFHLYGGKITALSQVHQAFPEKNVYFTEQWVGGPGNFSEDLKWHVGTLIIGATRNWSRNVIEWNLAADPEYKPHTEGGCSTCMGALTIGKTVKRNVSYYVIAHASKFVRPGSFRIDTNLPDNLPNVAFKRADGKKVLIVLNNDQKPQKFNIQYGGKGVSCSLDGGSVGTFIW